MGIKEDLPVKKVVSCESGSVWGIKGIYKVFSVQPLTTKILDRWGQIILLAGTPENH